MYPENKIGKEKIVNLDGKDVEVITLERRLDLEEWNHDQ